MSFARSKRMYLARNEMTALSVCKALLASLALATLCACSGAEELPPYLAANTFAGQHRAEIEFDCQQAESCAIRNSQELGPNAVEQCVAREATTLNADPSMQLGFLVKVNRCNDNADTCQYISCVQQGGIGFGEMQIDKVTHSCTAHVQCGMQSGTLTGNPNTIYNDCVLLRILALDKYTNDQRAAYQAAYWPCSSFQACQFTSCFMF